MVTERETVAEGLKCRAENRLMKDCEHCHYGWAMGRRWCCNFVKLSRDALKLLDRSAPRVLTEEELMALPDGSVVWEEFFNGEEGVATHLGPGMVCAGQIIIPDSQGDLAEADLAECLRSWPDDDGNDFRYWSARPTDEQREATAW